MSDEQLAVTQIVQVYRRPVSGALQQGEILSDVEYSQFTDETAPSTRDEMRDVKVPFAVCLSADCDLDQDYKSRMLIPSLEEALASNEDPEKQKELEHSLRKERFDLLSNVLFCSAFLLEEAKVVLLDHWQSIVGNNHERYHFLMESVFDEDLKNSGLPPLVIDFRKYFTIPTSEVYSRMPSDATLSLARRTQLVSPYLEHLTSRFAHYLSRVALIRSHSELTAVGETGLLYERLDRSSDSISLEDAKKLLDS